MTGKIIRGVGGFYYVFCPADGRTYQCRARGLFRKDGVKPLVGDDVSFTETIDTDIESSGQIQEVLPRKNKLVRPEAANVDQALVFFAAKDPEPSFLLLDRFLVFLALQDIPILLAFNKMDVAPERKEKLAEIYGASGYPCHFVSVYEGEGIQGLSEVLAGKTTILAGPSGTGKSSFVNLLLGREHMETGVLSHKTGRGKQTTRHTEILPIPQDGFILDTPGFSSLILFGVNAKELDCFYSEFQPYLGKCYYNDCTHRREPDCAVRGAVEEGRISRIRYETYLQLFEELP